MLRVKEGDVGQLAALFERHHKRIYHYCQRMTGNQTTSQDLVQDVFMRILKYRKTFRGDSRFLPWLYRMAHNACIDHFRKSSRDPLLPDELPEVTSGEPSASDRLEQGEDVVRLRQALMQLPEDKREVLILSRFELKKHAEIAELLDCSVGAVKVRVHRALKQLREIYFELSSEAV
jgi:RNA polymerase sigma-70 factor (ECF subfamily)